jgi:hypothetical protein
MLRYQSKFKGNRQVYRNIEQKCKIIEEIVNVDFFTPNLEKSSEQLEDVKGKKP